MVYELIGTAQSTGYSDPLLEEDSVIPGNWLGVIDDSGRYTWRDTVGECLASEFAVMLINALTTDANTLEPWLIVFSHTTTSAWIVQRVPP